jgi:small redox-active disulfide protein 2
MAETKQIVVAGKKVGLTGLEEVLEQVEKEALKSDAAVADRLLELVAKANYIPPAVEEDYRQALLREFKRFIGEAIPEVCGGLEIRVFGQGCARCDGLMNDVMAILSELELEADIEHVKDISRIAELGPVATPVLMINGKIASSGRVPHRKDLIRWLKEVEG